MQMPPPDEATLSQRAEIAQRLRGIVGEDHVVADNASLKAFESDGLSAYRQIPMLVALPADTGEVSRVLAYCAEQNVKVVPRGAGTGLSGGALPLADGITIGLGRLNKILEIDYANRSAVVQPGVANLAISQAMDAAGFYYAPDPSSQIACSIGGNIAENSGGVHCLKYGTTTNNVLGLEVVLANGEVVRVGGKGMDQAGYDLLGLLTGSEGLLAITTEATLRILPKPEVARAMMAVFNSVEGAGQAVADIIAAGMVPAGMEIMDQLSIEAVEGFVGAGYPLGVAALLLVELDGPESEVAHLIGVLEGLLRKAGASEIRRAESEPDRLRLWAGRKAAFPAMGRISPDYYCMDGTIPRGKLPEVLRRIGELSKGYGLRVANVFHAGDGNLHPLILYDSNVEGDLAKAEELGADILKLCVEVGGVLSGEHGIGIEKRDLMPCMFNDADLDAQERIKACFDVGQILNPGKVYPVLRRCAEGGAMHVHGGEEKFPELERF